MRFSRKFRTFSRASAQFRFSQKGVAAVEFALLIPILLVAYLGGVDVTQGLSADRKLGIAVSTISDLVSRHQNSVSIDEVNAYFTSANAIMRPFSGSDTKLRLTIVAIGSSGGTEIVDTEIQNGADTLEIGESYALPEEMTDLARNRSVVVAEGWFPFSPITGYVMKSDIGLYKRSITLLRHDSESFEIADNGSGNSNAAPPPPEEEEEESEPAPEPEPEPEDDDGGWGGWDGGWGGGWGCGWWC